MYIFYWCYKYDVGNRTTNVSLKTITNREDSTYCKDILRITAHVPVEPCHTARFSGLGISVGNKSHKL